MQPTKKLHTLLFCQYFWLFRCIIPSLLNRKYCNECYVRGKLYFLYVRKAII